jgi:hypothetical protein
MESTVVYTKVQDSAAAGRELAGQIVTALPGGAPDAVIVFASPRYDAPLLLAALDDGCRPGALVGASSAGEFTGEARGVDMACAMALRSRDARFTAACGTGLGRDPATAARQIATSFKGGAAGLPFRAALVMTDALAGHADELVDQLTRATGGQYQFFGGGAGDNAQFRRTQVFWAPRR